MENTAGRKWRSSGGRGAREGEEWSGGARGSAGEARRNSTMGGEKEELVGDKKVENVWRRVKERFSHGSSPSSVIEHHHRWPAKP